MTSSEFDADVVIAGEDLLLMPERSVFWPRRSTLFVADLHVGKAATFRAGGSPLPRGTTTADLARLSDALTRTSATRLVILGDLYHARAGQVDATMEVLRRWRGQHEGVEIDVVRGNHDLRSNPTPPELAFNELGERALDAPFILAHQPEDPDDGYVLAGHVHPGFVLRGAGGERMRLPCFHVGRRCAVLPAFGSFTGLAMANVRESDRIFVIADDAVFEVPQARRMR